MLECGSGVNMTLKGNAQGILFSRPPVIIILQLSDIMTVKIIIHDVEQRHSSV